MQIRNKKLLSFAFLLLAAGFLAFAGPALAQQAPELGLSDVAETGLSDTDPKIVIARIVQIALGFVGIILVSLGMYAGWLWMSSEGNPEQVEKAKKIIISAVIGLLIILSAFGIVTWLIRSVVDSTTDGTPDDYNPLIYNDENDGGGNRYCNGAGGTLVSATCTASSTMCDLETEYCSTDASTACLCLSLQGYGETCDGEDSAGCQAKESMCSPGLKCSEDTCECLGAPIIDAVTPDNGTSTNFITISGRFFGTAVGKVYFSESDADGHPTTTLEAKFPNSFNNKCNDFWKDTQVIVAVPSGSVDGPIRLVRYPDLQAPDRDEDTTDNDRGADIDFDVNDINRPGLCGLSTSTGYYMDSREAYGIGFNATPRTFHFGSYNANTALVGSEVNWIDDKNTTFTVPNLASGETGVFVVAGTTSNPLDFNVMVNSDLFPYIQSIDPDKGPQGQCITIKGSRFKKYDGNKSRVFFMDNTASSSANGLDLAQPCQEGGRWWQDEMIIVKVPNMDAGQYRVIVVNDLLRVSNEYPFEIQSGDPGPCLCAMDPQMGRAGVPVKLYGSGFGAAIGTVTFYDKASSSVYSSWNSQEIDSTVPASARSGTVYVAASSTDTKSNSLDFRVGSCEKDTDCPVGVCCGSGFWSGVCRANLSDCSAAEAEFSVFSWSFNVGKEPTQCNEDEEACGEACCLPGMCEDANYNGGQGKCSGCAAGQNQCGNPNSLQCCFDKCLTDAYHADSYCGSCTNKDESACNANPTCPNSPGRCDSKNYDQNCSACSAGFDFNVTAQKCAATTTSGSFVACSLSATTTIITDDVPAVWNISCGTDNHWHIDTNQSCPSGYARQVTGGDCISEASCTSCPDGAMCADLDGSAGGTGLCVNSQTVCPSGYECTAAGKCDPLALAGDCECNAKFPGLCSALTPCGYAVSSAGDISANVCARISDSAAPELLSCTQDSQCNGGFGFKCKTVTGYGETKKACVVDQPICAGNATCQTNKAQANFGKCIVNNDYTCECCCRVGNEQQDCCAGLTCGGSCGSGEDAEGNALGLCGGCASAPDPDAACNCEGTSGKFCDEDGDMNNDGSPEGVCRDCAGFGSDAEGCSAQTSCCFDLSNNSCKPIASGQTTVTGPTPSINYCGYQDCDDDIASTTGRFVNLASRGTSCTNACSNSEVFCGQASAKDVCCSKAVAGVPSTTSGTSTAAQQAACVLNDGQLIGQCKSCDSPGQSSCSDNACCYDTCQPDAYTDQTTCASCNIGDNAAQEVCRACAQITDIAECSLNEQCCFDGVANACRAISGNVSGGDESLVPNFDGGSTTTPSGIVNIQYCGYYDCQTNDGCSAASSPGKGINEVGFTGLYRTWQSCESGCNQGQGSGESCYDRQKQECGLTCANPNIFSCQGDNAGNDADCRCCCEPGTSTTTTQFGELFCLANKDECDGGDRGLMCGCVMDSECGQFAGAAYDGCGEDTCCHSRPRVSQTVPADEDSAFCRNGVLSVTFDSAMDPASLSTNIFLVVDNGLDECPENSYLGGQAGVFSRILGLIDSYVWKPIARLLADVPVLGRLEIINSASALVIPDSGHHYCYIKGSVAANNELTGSEQVTRADFTPDSLLPAGKTFYFIAKGDANPLDGQKDGVLDQYKVSFVGSSNIDLSGTAFSNSNIISFRTLPDEANNSGLCLVDRVAITPDSFLFNTHDTDVAEKDNDRMHPSFDSSYDNDKLFIARALAANGQEVYPIPSYDWSYRWSDVRNGAVISIISGQTANMRDNEAFVRASSTSVDDSDKLRATLDFTATPDAIDQADKVAESDINVFICQNPWPPVSDSSGSGWKPWNDKEDNCNAGNTSACGNTGFSMYYCRDSGGPGTADDLPAILNLSGNNYTYDQDEAAIRGSSTINSVMKEFYFFRQRAVNSISSTTVVAAGISGKVNLSWEPVSGVAGYRVYYGTSPNKYSDFVDVGSATTKTIDGLSDGTTYYFAITAYNSMKVESGYSIEKSAIPADNNSDSPDDLVGYRDNASSMNITLSWTKIEGVSGYKVFYGLNHANYAQSKEVGNVDKTVIQISSSTMMYFFNIQAKNRSGSYGPYGNEIVLIPGFDVTYINTLSNSSFEDIVPSTGLPAGWTKASPQKHAWVEATTTKSFFGQRSMAIIQQQGYDYPGKCTEATCNDLNSVSTAKCSWRNGDPKPCLFSPTAPAGTASKEFMNNEALAPFQYANRVTYTDFKYDVSDLDWEVGKDYVLVFYYRGSAAQDVLPNISASPGHPSLCADTGTPTCTGKPACPADATKCCFNASTTAPSIGQQRCYQKKDMAKIVKGSYSSGPRDGWYLYYSTFTYDDFLNNLVKSSGERVNYFGVIMSYTDTRAMGTEMYFDDFLIAKKQVKPQ